MCLYEALDIDKDATESEIKQAHRKAAQRTHPDREGGDTKQFQRVTAAYHILKDPDRRAKYDATGDTDTNPDPVTDRLAQLFNAIIDADEFDCNVVDKCKSMLASAIQSCNLELNKIDHKILRLSAQADRIRTSGHNLFENILQSKIVDLQKKADHMNSEIALLNNVKILVDDYSDNNPQSSSTGVVWGGCLDSRA
jgi:curved DNA-binding protein CbpA